MTHFFADIIKWAGKIPPMKLLFCYLRLGEARVRYLSLPTKKSAMVPGPLCAPTLVPMSSTCTVMAG